MSYYNGFRLSGSADTLSAILLCAGAAPARLKAMVFPPTRYVVGVVIGTGVMAMKLGQQPRKWLEKKAKRGFRGYPIGTIAFYGPDELRHQGRSQRRAGPTVRAGRAASMVF